MILWFVFLLFSIDFPHCMIFILFYMLHVMRVRISFIIIGYLAICFIVRVLAFNFRTNIITWSKLRCVQTHVHDYYITWMWSFYHMHTVKSHSDIKIASSLHSYNHIYTIKMMKLTLHNTHHTANCCTVAYVYCDCLHSCSNSIALDRVQTSTKLVSSIRFKARLVTIPNLVCDFSFLSRYVVDHSTNYWETLKRALKNLKKTRNFRVLVKWHKQLGENCLDEYVDSGFTSNKDNRRLQIGQVMFLFLLCW